MSIKCQFIHRSQLLESEGFSLRPYIVFCRTGVTYCHSTKHKFIPPKSHVEQAGIHKHQNNCKFHRKMPWPHSLVVQIITFRIHQPARFGFKGREGWLLQCHSTQAKQCRSVKAAAPSSTVGQTDTLSPGAGRAGERRQRPAKGSLMEFRAETKTR